MPNIKKNKQIAETMRLTRLKRNSQICKTFKFKVDKSRLNCRQKEGLKMLLVEAKWIYNYIISTDSAYSIIDKDLKVSIKNYSLQRYPLQATIPSVN